MTSAEPPIDPIAPCGCNQRTEDRTHLAPSIFSTSSFPVTPTPAS